MSEKIKLGEIIDTIQGSQYPLDEQITENKEGYLRFLRISDYTKSDEPIRYVKYSGKELICEENEVVVVRYGNVGFIGYGKKGILANNLFVLRLKNKNFDSKYLYYYLNSPNINNAIVNKANSSTMPALTHKMIKELEIPVVDIEKQKSIVSRLNKIQKIIDIRKEQIEYFDELIKSQFVEMFGEPLTSNNYGRVTLDKLTKVNQGLQIPISKRFNEDGKDRYKYITIQYLNGGKQTEYIENPNDRVICQKDDILMTRTGNTGQVITNVEGVFHNNFFKVDYDREKLNKEFLIKYFEDDGIYRDMIRRATTSTIPDLSHSEFYKMSIDLPPIELQNEFAELVKQINQQKFEIEKSLKEMKKLQESLMNKYFGG